VPVSNSRIVGLFGLGVLPFFKLSLYQPGKCPRWGGKLPGRGMSGGNVRGEMSYTRCRNFPSGPQLSFQTQIIAGLRPEPAYTAWYMVTCVCSLQLSKRRYVIYLYTIFGTTAVSRTRKLLIALSITVRHHATQPVSIVRYITPTASSLYHDSSLDATSVGHFPSTYRPRTVPLRTFPPAVKRNLKTGTNPRTPDPNRSTSINLLHVNSSLYIVHRLAYGGGRMGGCTTPCKRRGIVQGDYVQGEMCGCRPDER